MTDTSKLVRHFIYIVPALALASLVGLGSMAWSMATYEPPIEEVPVIVTACP